ncbi:hypothetical protein SPAB_04658 [Salmonella enterica subsp. enterica serovar Paratyphi B str. SPB7]|uniref:Lipoprotein n=1 Tax=Salmonella paratyphi B (strain ATCC BAA-1250 / SPB7) TaxID=1016998 RepID=A0A6C6Z7K2_SALPB|nr:hypothetical protein SPAB_04658 [Salmonella enterica subsp. enterica serovar Paratyphi B str. SPB7]
MKVCRFSLHQPHLFLCFSIITSFACNLARFKRVKVTPFITF